MQRPSAFAVASCRPLLLHSACNTRTVSVSFPSLNQNRRVSSSVQRATSLCAASRRAWKPTAGIQPVVAARRSANLFCSCHGTTVTIASAVACAATPRSIVLDVGVPDGEHRHRTVAFVLRSFMSSVISNEIGAAVCEFHVASLHVEAASSNEPQPGAVSEMAGGAHFPR